MFRTRYFLILLSALLFCNTAYSQYVYPEGPFTIYFPTVDKVYAEGSYKNSKPEGTWTFYKYDKPYHWPAKVYHYKNGLLNGEYLGYSTGKVVSTGYYINNMKNGTWKRLDSKGEVFQIHTYRNDTLEALSWMAASREVKVIMSMAKYTVRLSY